VRALRYSAPGVGGRVTHLGRDPSNMRWVIVFWLWLESVGHHNFIRRAYAMPGPSCLGWSRRRPCASAASPARARTPPTAASRACSAPTPSCPIPSTRTTWATLSNHRKKILKGVTYMYKTVCLVACIGNADTRALAGNSNTSGAALPRSSSPGNCADTLPMSSPGLSALAPLMISSPGHRALPL
jgi:hypothetical protein